MKKRHVEEMFFKVLMIISSLIVVVSLGSILFTILLRGLPSLSWAMITQTPKGGYYLGGDEGGILNAIVGSLYMAGGGTVLAFLISLPIVLCLGLYLHHSPWAKTVRLAMDVLWGIPSIVYGAFGFTIMLALGVRASLLGGILVLSLIALPIMTRAMDEVINLTPKELAQASYALGATRLETALLVVVRQIMPGITTALLLAFGRSIGCAASVLFTAGYTDHLPTSLFRPAASLPLAVFFQLGTPFPEVQQRAYAAALVLTIIVLVISISSRWLSSYFGRFTIR